MIDLSWVLFLIATILLVLAALGIGLKRVNLVWLAAAIFVLPPLL